MMKVTDLDFVCRTAVLGFVILCSFGFVLGYLKKKGRPASFIQEGGDFPACEFDVFLSFCGKDTRKGFTDCLYRALKNASIDAFRDDDELRIGGKIDWLLEAVEQSRIFIPILSKNYASREWCLRELAKAVECNKKLKILPVFYDVKPSVVRDQSENYRKELLKHERRLDKNIVRRWREALTLVTSLKGWELQEQFNGYEGELIDAIVSTVWKELRKAELVVPTVVKGMESFEKEIMELLDVNSKDVRIIGIYGNSGSEKTLLAKYIYNKIYDQFERCSFLAKIKETSQGVEGLVSLQRQLIDDLLEGRGPGKVYNVDEGIKLISRKFYNKKVLILLDDIDKKEQLDGLAKEPRWFGSGSRIIVTTQEREILEVSEVHGLCAITNPQRNSRRLLSKSIVGPIIQDATKVIVANLKQDKVKVIGIYGMGGVGKTTVALNVHDYLVENPSSFKELLWITVSQNCSFTSLQDKIAKKIGITLAVEDEEIERSAKLSEALQRRGNILLFLDDIWESISLEGLGISCKGTECKLLITSRSYEVCIRMGCQRPIKIDPLDEVAAWDLFISNLEFDKITSETYKVAKEIVQECAGLPLALITMGSSMRAVQDIAEWRDTLQRLKDSKEGHKDMDLNVFPILKVSYDRLHDRKVQECFLYCAVYPEDRWIPTRELFYRLIDVGLIRESTIQAEFDRGHAIINQLERASLLEIDCEDFEVNIKMHDLVRDMALRIKGSNFLVTAGLFLHQIPDEENWTNNDSYLNVEEEKQNKNLELVSLMHNNIKDISNISPNCPNLSVLLLNCNGNILKRISNCFFEHMLGLKILDLSCTGIEELPKSVGELVKLTALVLNTCVELKVVPSLEKLTALRTLDLYYTAIEQVPVGLEKLVNLRYLSLRCLGIEKVPIGILPKLYRLRHLEVNEVNKEEITSLENMEILYIWFSTWADYKAFLMSCFPVMPKLKYFRITVANDIIYAYSVMSYDPPYRYFDRVVKMISCNVQNNIKEDFFPVPKGTYDLPLSNMHNGKSLSIHDCIDLQTCQITRCDGIESVFSSLSLGDFRRTPLLSHLRYLNITSCDWIKKVFDFGFFPTLPNLFQLEVSECEKMEEIISAPADEDVSLMPILTFPKLQKLELNNLPNLKSISRCSWICNSLEEVEIKKCPKVKKIPLSLEMVNGQLSPPPSFRCILLGDCYLGADEVEKEFDEAKRWWQSLEWDDSNAERVLRPFTKLLCEERVDRKLSEELKVAMSLN